MGNNEQPMASCGVGKLDIWRVTLSAALAWTIAYVVCVAFGLAFPQWEMHSAWQAFLPGFKWLSLGSFVLGLVEVFLITGFMAWLFALVYNALGRRAC